jgi:3-isopropylmalate/(R)-2-methylmalate dehydratase large subunit
VEKAKVDVGEKIEIEPDLVTTHLNTCDTIDNFKELNTDLVWNPNKIFISLANCSNQFYDNPASKYKQIREFVKRQGIKSFYEASDGICYQVAMEKGHILPGQLIAGSDKYMTSYGALATSPINLTTDHLARIWSGEKAELNIPPTVQINITGRRSRGVYGKDIALSVIKQLAPVDIKGKAIEFYGNSVNQMSISERITLCNHTADVGAVTATCHFDSVTRRYLTGRTMANYIPVIADKNAEYHEIYQINIDHLSAQLATPNDPDNIKPVTASEGLPVNVIIIGSVVNGRFDDLRVAAEVLKNKKVNSECRLLVYPGSRSVYIEALKKGLIRVLTEAGAVIVYPGYPEHTGITGSLLDEGDRVLATSNNNLIPSIKHDRAEIYLCSPATAAASALNGSITEPSRFVK